MRILRNETCRSLGLIIPAGITTSLAVPKWKIPELSFSTMLYWAKLAENRHKILLGILGAVGLYVLFWTAWDLVKIYRNKKQHDEKADDKKRIGFILSRFAILGMLIFVLSRFYDLLWLYQHRFPIAILFAWLIVTILFVRILGRFGRWGTIGVLTVHHIVLLGLTALFLLNLPLYRFSIPLFAGQVLLVNALILFREKTGNRIAAKKTFWIVAAVFGSFVFAPVFTHPSVAVAKKPPRFGSTAIVRETEGIAILQAKVSEKGTNLFFITDDKEKGLGRVNLKTRKVEYDNNGMENFSVLERFEGEDILAVGAVKAESAQIAVFSMDPYQPIGHYTMPTAAISPSRIGSMATTPKRTYATVSSPIGSFLLACPATNRKDLENPQFRIRCMKTPMENETLGFVAASDFVNRMLLGISIEPFGACYLMKEWLSQTLKQRQDIRIGRGAMDMKFGPNQFRLFIGRPFTEGIEVADSTDFRIVGKIPGPFCITTIYAGKRYVAGGSYLEGEVVIYDTKTRRSKTVRLGPKITDIDYNEALNDFFVATGSGVYQIDLDLLFDESG